MSPKKVPTHAPGVYLFQRPEQIALEIDKEAIVVFWYPPEKALGLVVCPDPEDTKTFYTLLETVRDKLLKLAQTPTGDIQVKMFGFSTSHSDSLDRLRAWIQEQGFSLVSSDTERGVTRKLVIEGESGLVGVRYAEGSLPEAPPFLRTGTARQRFPVKNTETRFLALSSNRVTRVLLRQTLEESPTWEATVPENWEKELARKNWKKFPFDFVLVAEDVEDAGFGRKLATWLIRICQEHPRLVVCWVGHRRMPAFKTGFMIHSLPAPQPQLITDFKYQLTRLVSEEPLQTTGRVVPFKGKRRRKIA